MCDFQHISTDASSKTKQRIDRLWSDTHQARSKPPQTPEDRLADEFRNELGVYIDSQALRMFVRSRWRIIAALAHSIHGSDDEEWK